MVFDSCRVVGDDVVVVCIHPSLVQFLERSVVIDDWHFFTFPILHGFQRPEIGQLEAEEGSFVILI